MSSGIIMGDNNISDEDIFLRIKYKVHFHASTTRIRAAVLFSRR